MNRAKQIERLEGEPATPWDVIIIGGGAVGLGAAVDAASRGYRTILLEQADFGQGTSSRSTKLVHGGVRYLRQGNLKLVKEALRERATMLKLAPQLVEPLRFLIPNQRWSDRAFYGAGMKAYDWLAGQRNIAASHHLTKKETEATLPELACTGLRGATCYFDAQFNDARYAIALARTAIEQQATVLNYFQVTALINEDARIIGVEVIDKLTSKTYQVRGKVVVNAAGIFSDHIRNLEEPGAEPQLRFSQGIHLSFPASLWNSHDAMIVPKTEDGRVLFAIPWEQHLLVGTTDTPVEQPQLEPRPLEEEVDYILDHLRSYLRAKLSREQVGSVFAGLRPLVRPSKQGVSSAKVSREHAVITSQQGVVSILGGKWTTYRKMAEDTIDQAVEVAGLENKPCRTDQLPLAIGKLDESHPSSEVGANAPLHSELKLSLSDIESAIVDEMAIQIDDVLARRTRCLFVDARAAKQVAPVVARQLASAQGRTAEWADEQVVKFNQLADQYLVELH